MHYVSFVYSVVAGDCKGRIVIGECFGDHSGSLVLQHVFWVFAHLFSLLLAGRQVECHPVSNGEIGERLPISIQLVGGVRSFNGFDIADNLIECSSGSGYCS